MHCIIDDVLIALKNIKIHIQYSIVGGIFLVELLPVTMVSLALLLICYVNYIISFMQLLLRFRPLNCCEKWIVYQMLLCFSPILHLWIDVVCNTAQQIESASHLKQHTYLI